MNLEIVIINMLMWLAAAYIITFLARLILIFLKFKFKKVLYIKLFRLIRVYYICDWDYFLKLYNKQLKIYPSFLLNKRIKKGFVLLYLCMIVFSLCFIDIFISPFLGYSSSEVFLSLLFLKVIVYTLLVCLFLPIIFASYTWKLIKDNCSLKLNKDNIIHLFSKFYYLLVFPFEIIVLLLKILVVAFSRYSKNVFIVTLSIGTFFEVVYPIYLETILYRNIFFEQNIVGISVFLFLFISFGIFASSIYRPIYLNELSHHYDKKDLMNKEWSIFRFGFTILISILAIYLLYAYSTDYAIKNGYEIPCNELFDWSRVKDCDCGRHNNEFNITFSNAPLQYKKLKAYFYFSMSLLALTFIVHSFIVMFMSKNE